MNWPVIIQASPLIAALVVLVGGVGTYVKIMPEMRRIKSEGDASLRGDLLARIAVLDTRCEGLEHQLIQEREDCHSRVSALQVKHEQAYAAVFAELQILRHEKVNGEMVVEGLLMMLEAGANVTEVVPKIREMMERRAGIVATEKAAMPALKAKAVT